MTRPRGSPPRTSPQPMPCLPRSLDVSVTTVLSRRPPRLASASGACRPPTALPPGPPASSRARRPWSDLALSRQLWRPRCESIEKQQWLCNCCWQCIYQGLRTNLLFSRNHMPLSSSFTDSPSAGQSPRLSAVMVAVVLSATPRFSSTPTSPRSLPADTAVFPLYVHLYISRLSTGYHWTIANISL